MWLSTNQDLVKHQEQIHVYKPCKALEIAEKTNRDTFLALKFSLTKKSSNPNFSQEVQFLARRYHEVVPLFGNFDMPYEP